MLVGAFLFIVALIGLAVWWWCEGREQRELTTVERCQRLRRLMQPNRKGRETTKAGKR